MVLNVVLYARKERKQMDEKEKKPLSEARKRATAKYHAKFQQVKFYCEPDLYEEVKSYCSAQGISMAQFIKDSMRRGMES